MERRLLTFLIAWTALFLLFNSLRPKPQPQVPVDAVAQKDAADGNDAGEPIGDDAGNDADNDAADDQPNAGRPAMAELVTMGSMDPADQYSLLVTLNTRGGGIERIEVTERDDGGDLKYRRVDVRHGYLGYLGTREALDRPVRGDSPDPSGASVSVVGPGTPAAAAGLQVGDVIETINGESVNDEDSIDNVLLQTQPGDTASIEIFRDGKKQTLTATLSNHPLDLVRLATTAGIDQVVGNETKLSCLMKLATVGGKSIGPSMENIPGVADASDLIWKLDDVQFGPQNHSVQSTDDGTVVVNLNCPMVPSETGSEMITLSRSYTLHRNSYAMDMNVAVTNNGSSPQDVAYRLEGPNGITMEGWWYSNKITRNFFGGSAARDVIYDLATESTPRLLSGYDLLKRAKSEPENPDEVILAAANAAEAPNLDYIGVDAQYFLVTYLPNEGDGVFDQYRRVAADVVTDPNMVAKHKERAVNSSFYLDSDVTTLAAGETLSHSLRMFAGPKDPEVLAPYGLSEAVYYGWFSLFAKALALLLHMFSAIGNYAIAIVLLTVLVRGAMFPLSRKAALNAQKMQELAPELKKIGEQYKDDMEGRLRAQQALQKKAGFNPLAGCLPMFIQLPIFIGLYRALAVDIELRQQPLLPGLDWASNLAAPDMAAFWADSMPDFIGGRGTGWLGPYFNILPIIVVILFLAQQKLFMPPATDDQTRLTQRMMSIMTLMMGLFFFKVPAGLCVYFITSSLWGIAERIFVKKTIPPAPTGGLAVEGGPDEPKSSGSVAQRLKDKFQTPEPNFDRPNKRKRPGRK